MKCIFLLFLVLPNVISFVIHSPRRKRANVMGELLEMRYGRHCSEMFTTIKLAEKEEWDALTNSIRTYRPVLCEENKYCIDEHGPVNFLYYCKPDPIVICLKASGSFCVHRSTEYVHCGCKHRESPESLDFNKLIPKIIN